jgi:hypothetical protein
VAPSPGAVYKDYFDNEKLSDLTIRIGDRRIHVHRLVLSSHSAYFNTLLTFFAISLFVIQVQSTLTYHDTSYLQTTHIAASCHGGILGRYLQRFFNYQTLSDLTIRLSDRTVCVNRIVLCRRSKYFHKLTLDGFKVSTPGVALFVSSNLPPK